MRGKARTRRWRRRHQATLSHTTDTTNRMLMPGRARTGDFERYNSTSIHSTGECLRNDDINKGLRVPIPSQMPHSIDIEASPNTVNMRLTGIANSLLCFTTRKNTGNGILLIEATRMSTIYI